MEPLTLTATQLDALNRPAPFTTRPNFLGERMIERLLQYAEAHKAEFKANRIGQVEKLDQAVSVSLTLKEIGNFRTEIKSKVLSILPNIFRELGCALFEPVKFETLMSAYGDGAFYAQHIDTWSRSASETSDRMITMVYYFHALPKIFSGGILRLHSLAARGSFVDIEPVSDTAVFFLSWFPHEVLAVSCPNGGFMDSRFAITCIIHKERSRN
jgi:Rps23 Pro-64 3,4-dihydroxylase Tpa1-like proline 4-hydroxylase